MPDIAKRILETFLAPLPVCVRRKLLYQPITAAELLDYVNNSYNADELRPQLEGILRKLPQEYREYRQRAQASFERLRPYAEMLCPPIPEGLPGRPRKEPIAEEAKELKQRGLNNPQIAARLNQNHGEGTATTDGVRKLLSRYSRSDKT